MSNGGQLSLKLLKIPSVSEIEAAKKAAEEATKRKIENARLRPRHSLYIDIHNNNNRNQSRGFQSP